MAHMRYGTRLHQDLEVNAPMPVISGILGHNNLNTTRLYLSIDIENLRFLSLEVTAYEDN